MSKNFDFDSIKNFDEHIDRSIPNYDILFESILRVSEYFIIDTKAIYDIGCSTGKLLLKLYESYPDVKMVGLDNSSNLLPKDIKRPIFIHTDLNASYQFSNACIIYSIFTLQFLRKERRLKLLTDVYNGLCKGGAFIIAEKTYSENSMIQDIFTFAYYDYKKTSFTEKEILDKERDLRKILRPNERYENLELLDEAGFNMDKRELLYKYFNFEAYICIK